MNSYVRTNKWWRRALLVTCVTTFVCANAGAAFAQTGSLGTIHGTVTDESGATLLV